METLINETTLNFFNSCDSSPDELIKSGKLLLLCGDKFETPNIDTIYEVYISGHAFNQAFNRVGHRQINYNEIVILINKILECAPIKLLNTPQDSSRHIVFDIFNNNIIDKNNIIQVACVVGATKPTKLTYLLKQKYKNVMMCNIVVKTIIELPSPQFSKTDLINNAIHIPISINDTIDLDENEFIIRCDIGIINKLIYNNISARRILDNCNKGIKVYPYVEFLQTLEDMNIVNYPKHLDIGITPNKHSVISTFESFNDIISTNLLSVKELKSLHEFIYRGGKHINRYELINQYKNQILFTLIPSGGKYKTPTDAVIDYLLTKQGLQLPTTLA